ncbi:hypothetical protein OSB04_029563 [Centaurea solstitialis]|uniref:PRONE domain-containing protein n=1 Tax=Centaurea solstitialis TaxID=347529 RepID=A0AA38SIK1_9ASTR|nr:hypothetical protein OSB04_029563 [Centaurea solstitialis]
MERFLRKSVRFDANLGEFDVCYRFLMVLLRRRLNCCTWFKGISNSIDLDQQPPDTEPSRHCTKLELPILETRLELVRAFIFKLESAESANFDGLGYFLTEWFDHGVQNEKRLIHNTIQPRIMTYNGLESCILNSNSYEDESVASKGDGFPTDSPDEDTSSCCSSNNPSGSSFSQWTTMKRDEHGLDEWEYSDSPTRGFIAKEKPSYAVQFSDVEVMKENFAKLLLGEDMTGGRDGVSAALALSNAITNLAGSVFGELWKLEPLPEEKRIKWRREMDWLLSPTNYMVQLIPAKQCGADGRTLEIMTPKARGDVHLNLPALRKLDSMLLETLDSMTDMEFWYEEGGSRAEGRTKNVKQSKRWWLPMPQVPIGGLSDGGRKKLLNQAKLVHQIFKAAKSINETILLEMPIPKIIGDALPKVTHPCSFSLSNTVKFKFKGKPKENGKLKNTIVAFHLDHTHLRIDSPKASLGEDLYKILNRIPSSAAGMLRSLSLKSENHALDAINRLEAAIHAWKEKIEEHDSGKSPARTSWSFKDPILEFDKMELLINRAEDLSREIQIRYPNLPQKFLDVMKIQYGKDVAHAILEAYSRVLGNLAFSILTRIGDICQEDVLSDPGSPLSLPGLIIPGILGSSTTLINKVNNIEGKSSSLQAEETSVLSDEAYTRSVTSTPKTEEPPNRQKATLPPHSVMLLNQSAMVLARILVSFSERVLSPCAIASAGVYTSPTCSFGS